MWAADFPMRTWYPSALHGQFSKQFCIFKTIEIGKDKQRFHALLLLVAPSLLFNFKSYNPLSIGSYFAVSRMSSSSCVASSTRKYIPTLTVSNPFSTRDKVISEHVARSSTCARLHDKSTGLYLYGDLYIADEFVLEMLNRQ